MSENLDIISIGECLIELSTNKSLTYATNLEKYYGGDSICTAVAASRLGSKVGYITRVGDDYFKEFLMDSWQAEHIDISQVKLVDGINGVYFISRLETGEKEIAPYRRKTAATNLSIKDICEDYIEKAQIIYSTGITQSLSLSAREAVTKAFSIAKEKGLTVAYDPNYRSKHWDANEAREAMDEIIDYVDIIFLNSVRDAKKLIDIESPDKIIKYFWDKGVSKVIVKMNSDGFAIGYNGEISYIKPIEGKIIDATGAGDAFNGAFLHGIATKLTCFESARLASIVEAFQKQGIGSVKSIPYKDKVYMEFKGCED